MATDQKERDEKERKEKERDELLNQLLFGDRAGRLRKWEGTRSGANIPTNNFRQIHEELEAFIASAERLKRKLKQLL